MCRKGQASDIQPLRVLPGGPCLFFKFQLNFTRTAKPSTVEDLGSHRPEVPSKPCHLPASDFGGVLGFSVPQVHLQSRMMTIPPSQRNPAFYVM